MARKGIQLRLFLKILNCLGEIGLEKNSRKFTNAEGCHVIASLVALISPPPRFPNLSLRDLEGLQLGGPAAYIYCQAP